MQYTIIDYFPFALEETYNQSISENTEENTENRQKFEISKIGKLS